jgi:hypothetical protein
MFQAESSGSIATDGEEGGCIDILQVFLNKNHK